MPNMQKTLHMQSGPKQASRRNNSMQTVMETGQTDATTMREIQMQENMR